MRRSAAMSPTAAILLLAAGLLTGCGSSAQPKKTPPPAAPADPQQRALNELQRVAPQAVMVMSGDLKPLETAFEDWFYPHARALETSKDIERKISGRGITGNTQLGFRTAMTTEADFQTVVRHYAAKMIALAPYPGDDADEPWLPSGRASRFAAGASLVYDVNGDAGPKHDPREGLQQATFVLQAANCSVHLTINRAPDEDLTYIHVVFNKWPVAER